MAYRDDIIALGANHLWPCDGNLNDIIGTLNYVNSGGVLTGPQICEDITNSYVTNGTNDSAAAASDPSVQDVTVDYSYSLWFQTDSNQQPPCRVFGDGGQTVNNSFFLGFGNSIVCESDFDPTIAQVGADISIASNRSYHLALVVRDVGGGSSELEFFIDGVSKGTQTVADVSNAGRGGFRIGGVTGTTSYSIGGIAFQLVSPVDGRYAMVNSFTGANVPTATEIREELFEKGALPGVTIASDTIANMQAALDAIASTVRPNEPLNIRVEDNDEGTSDWSLTANNITHDPLASIHIQYMGTDTLTWINSNGSNASIGSAPNGGSINIVTPATLTVSPIETGSEVRIYESGTINEVAGIENSGTSFQATINVSDVDIVVHSISFQAERIQNVDMTAGDVTVPVSQIPDRQYENP